MTGIYNLLGALLKLIYDMTGHYALAIIIFTIVIKLLLYPLTHAQNKSMKAMQEMQPEIDEIKKKYPNDQNKQNQLTMELYQKYKINPFMGCLPLLIQLPILFGLFAVLRDPVKYVFKTEAAYMAVDQGFFWISSMSEPDVIMIGSIALPFILPIIAALTTFVDTALMQKGQAKNQMTTTMLYMVPIMILMYGRSFPAGLSLYWAVSNIFSIIQKQLVKPMLSAKTTDTKGPKGAK